MNAYPSRPNPRVLVTPRSMTRGDNAAVERLVAAGLEVVIPAPGLQPTRAQLLEVLPEIDVWIAGVEPIDDALLGSAPWLRAVCRNGAGIDSVDVEAAKARNISVLPARGANALGVAELALGLIIASFRGLLPAATALRDGRWERSTGRELAGSTLGIAGFGAIGRHLARLAQGCGMTVLAYDPYVSEAPSGVTLLPLESLLASADVVSLHLPPLPTGPLLGVDQLALLRPGTFVLNTARAELVDGAAMLAALESGTVAGYAVDAFATEPPVIDALLAHPRVLATPHLGAATAESISRASEAAVDNALGVLGLE